jgi:ketosteroid isomerase-like protein
MSQANVELVQAIIDGFDAGVPRTDLIDADLEYVNPPYAVEAGTRRGREALNGVFDVYPDFHLETERFIDAGDDIVVIGIAHGTSPSGLTANWKQGHVWTIRDGKAVRFYWFSDPAEAIRTAIANSFRASMEAYSRGDFDAALEHFHPDIEWSVDARVQPDAQTYRGHEGVREFWHTWAEVMDDMTLVIEECRALDERVVLAVVRARGKGAGSGIEVESGTFAQIAEFENGLTVRTRLFGDKRHALAAAGFD